MASLRHFFAGSSPPAPPPKPLPVPMDDPDLNPPSVLYSASPRTSQPFVSSPLNPHAPRPVAEHPVHSSSSSSSASASSSASSHISPANSNDPAAVPGAAGSVRPPSHTPVSSREEGVSLLDNSIYQHSSVTRCSRPESGFGDLPDHYEPDALYDPPSNAFSNPAFRNSQTTLYDRNSLRNSMVHYSVVGPLVWDEKNAEPDDYLHDPEDEDTPRSGCAGFLLPTKMCVGRPSPVAILNVLSLALLIAGFLALFLGWPVGYYTTRANNVYGWNVGGTNASGQMPAFTNFPSLVDEDTPSDAHTWTNADGTAYDIVFSDEFNKDGRTFWPGDDPFWEAQDMHYWATTNQEWYDPDTPTTNDGNLEITMTEQPIHNLNFRSGMITSWNKLCFTGGYIEVNISLPGTPQSQGLWPAAWLMGNLGRAGYGATTQGVWPYSYNTCDVGTMQNQTNADGTPQAAHTTGSQDYGGQLSQLPGQKLSACTCSGEDHPGPNNNVGRGSPEIDIIEAQVSNGQGTASQSLQIAPFDASYAWDNLTSNGMEMFNSDTVLNQWKGSITQESASAVTPYGTGPYNGAGYATFGFEWVPGENGHVTWYVNGQRSWQIKAGAFSPNDAAEIGQRLISEEPMYIILNLGLSNKFQTILYDRITFPTTFRIDYVRVFQQEGQRSVTCDPDSYPTYDYIHRHPEAYSNPNATTWTQANFTWPKNSRVDSC